MLIWNVCGLKPRIDGILTEVIGVATLWLQAGAHRLVDIRWPATTSTATQHAVGGLA